VNRGAHILASTHDIRVSGTIAKITCPSMVCVTD
jgi:hypothetical protein